MYKNINNFLNINNTKIIYNKSADEVEAQNEILKLKKIKVFFFSTLYYNNFLKLINKAEATQAKFTIINYKYFIIIYIYDYVFIYRKYLKNFVYFANIATIEEEEEKKAIQEIAELMQYKNGRSKKELINKIQNIKNIILTENKKEEKEIIKIINKNLNSIFYIYQIEKPAEATTNKTIKKIIASLENKKDLIYQYLYIY